MTHYTKKKEKRNPAQQFGIVLRQSLSIPV